MKSSDESKKINLELIAEKNPNVDMCQLEEALQILKELNIEGIERSEYSLISPYSRSALGTILR